MSETPFERKTYVYWFNLSKSVINPEQTDHSFILMFWKDVTEKRKGDLYVSKGWQIQYLCCDLQEENANVK